MYQIGDVVVYGTEGLCEIEQITEKNFGGEIINRRGKFCYLCTYRKQEKS